MMADEDSSSPPAAPSKVTLTEVKYSLPDLLAEIEAEKSHECSG